MGDMLSQAEIDALLNGVSIEDEPKVEVPEIKPVKLGLLTDEEKDALGEIGNISMGTSATTLYALLGQRVNITTPRVEETTWDEVSKMFVRPYVAVKVQYTEGLKGCNLLVMKEEDVKIITDLMMGGDGFGNVQGELNELHLSAISEAMNQMVGSSSTSLSSMFEKRVDISPPESTLINAGTDVDRIRIDKDSNLVAILFSLKVAELIDSEIMQILPVSFAKEMVSNLLRHNEPQQAAPKVEPQAQQTLQMPPVQQMPQQQYQMPPQQMQMPPQQMQMPPMQQIPQYGMQQPMQQPMQQNSYGQQYGYPQMQPQQPAYNPVNVQPVHFQAFDDGFSEFDKKNIGLLMDVPLQIAVELGRTTKKIREILEFGQGSIIELDKLAGEPVDILVNGKTIAKGEVVVIDESFGVRITDIIHPSKRL
ncbi:MAG: flagellar motor switch phosphatase FliY [Clostridia bacterium]|nr:flagellar motor switch phosphatase FliY [Clostridia bacterium]